MMKQKRKAVRFNLTYELDKRTEKYQTAHKRRTRWHRALSVLAALTVFITTYALILPAITKEPSPGIKLERDFLWENEEVAIKFSVKGRAVFENEETEHENLSSQRVELSVIPLGEKSTVFKKYEEYAEEQIGSEDAYKLLALKLTFTYEGEKLDMSTCVINAEVTSKDGIEKWYQDNVASTEDEDRVMAFTTIKALNSDNEETVYLSEATDSISLKTSMSGMSDTMAFAMYSTINPTFTVQYYSYHEVLASSGDKSLDEIDTSGAKLPVNGGPNNMTGIYLNYVGGGKYVLATKTVLDQLENQVTGYEYVKAPGVAYVDKLRANGNYTLDEVWVLKDGKSANSVTRSDWNIYSATVSFTNRESSASSSRIYITDGTIIRLVYKPTSGSYTNAVDFYDYDISSGYSKSGGVTTATTANNGINKFTALSGTAKYAFGNVNANTNFGNDIWINNGKNNFLNKYNSVNSAYDGCTFGMVTGINTDGTLIFAEGISAPVLFGKTDGTGKTYFDNYSLHFSRSGDTYTLMSVNGTTVKDLDKFNNPSFTYQGSTTTYSNIFTNNFWPMDSAPTWGASGHDPKFGNITAYKNNTVVGKNGNSTVALPASDDGVDHNSYFGMQYKLNFTLTKDYAGPLDYVFYGDDDMWVFLDGKLVCDIGGVHSSVGQYVNLWDYINKMPEGEKYGEHTLYFCYTERGASGSTCYMRFTLPSVSIDTPQIENNTLEIGKKVEGANTDMEFEFHVELLDGNGNALVDDYSYTHFGSDGVAIGDYIINSDNTTVYLSSGEYIQIKYLPKGVKYRITEMAYDGFHASYKIGEGQVTEGYAANGTLTADIRVQFINSTSMQLPHTGGGGILLYCVPFILALGYAVISPIVIRYSEKRRSPEGAENLN